MRDALYEMCQKRYAEMNGKLIDVQKRVTVDCRLYIRWIFKRMWWVDLYKKKTTGVKTDAVYELAE